MSDYIIANVLRLVNRFLKKIFEKIQIFCVFYEIQAQYIENVARHTTEKGLIYNVVSNVALKNAFWNRFNIGGQLCFGALKWEIFKKILVFCFLAKKYRMRRIRSKKSKLLFLVRRRATAPAFRHFLRRKFFRPGEGLCLIAFFECFRRRSISCVNDLALLSLAFLFRHGICEIRRTNAKGKTVL